MTKTVRETAIGTPDWVLCQGCRGLVYGKRLVRNLKVCPDCGSHQRLTAFERIDMLFDRGSVAQLGFPVWSGDPLDFVDLKPYPQRIEEARAHTGMAEAVQCVRGAIDGNWVIAAVMDFHFLGGSLGGAVGELITRAAETALRERTPLLIVTASGGARMQEGALSLMQMAKTAQALGQLDEAGILTISLVTDPTYGGVAASFATLCDITVAEPAARLGFAGRRVIEQTIKQSLPAGFQTAEFLLERGAIDTIRRRSELRPTLARLLSIGSRRDDGMSEVACDGLIRDPGRLVRSDPWTVVRKARQLDRPTTLDYIGRIIDDFEELHGDKLAADCAAIVGGVGRLAGIPLVVIGHQKAHTIAELAQRNYGMPTPAGYRKAARLMRLAAKVGLPVITLVDTPGAYPGVEAEEQGQASAIAENLRLMARLPVPVVSVITGEGGSGGALALAVADMVLMFANAVYSVISPEGCAAILWKDPSAASTAAAALQLDAAALLRLSIVDGVVPEPDGGVGEDPARAAELLRAALVGTVRRLLDDDELQLVAKRHARFRRYAATVDLLGADGGAAQGGDRR
jgi:acetyl-CoA carboxylase carboxyl transferase alpha subunit/acetyl-CoA carboxylase carboxyl transferase beta subunit